jgi:hypothetical protein
MTELALGRDGATTSPGIDARRVLQLLALLSLAYWPLATAGPRARRPQADGPPPAMAADRIEKASV